MLYDQYYGLCIKIAFRYVNTYEQATEVVHDAFLKMFRNFSRFEVRDKEKVEMLLIGWIRRVVINAAIDYMRREINNTHSYPIPEHVWEHKDHGQSSDNSVLYKELIALVKELPPAYRMVFNLHGEAFVLRVERRAFGDGPRLQHAFHLQAEVIVQARGAVLLDDEAPLLAFVQFWRRLGRLLEVSLAFVFFEGHAQLDEHRSQRCCKWNEPRAGPGVCSIVDKHNNCEFPDFRGA